MKIKYSIKPWDDIIRVGDWVYQEEPDWQMNGKYLCYKVESINVGLNLTYLDIHKQRKTCHYHNKEDFKKARPNQPDKYIYEN